ncbi:MAG TPA: type II secretion system protein [Candidatus Dormibacteraeota bacterium]
MTTIRTERQRHHSERGMTLIELLVATSITAVIALSLGAALSLSLRLIGPQGAQGQEVASSSLLSLEGQISTDMSHAECVITTGSCPGPVAALTAACQPGFAVCVAWCDQSSPQAASYLLNVAGTLVRQDAAGITLPVAFEVQSLRFDASIPPGNTSPQLQVTLKAGTNRPEQATFTARSTVTGAAGCP